MSCRNCLNRDNFRPGILLKMAKIQRLSFLRKCDHGYTQAEIEEVQDRLKCTMKDRKPALQKFTLNVYLNIISNVLHSKNYCDGRIKLIEDELNSAGC